MILLHIVNNSKGKHHKVVKNDQKQRPIERRAKHKTARAFFVFARYLQETTDRSLHSCCSISSSSWIRLKKEPDHEYIQ